MKPSIGRIVHYQFEEDKHNGGALNGKVLPGIIVVVKNADAYKDEKSEPERSLSGRVDIEVFGVSALSHNERGTLLRKDVPFSPELKAGHWSWPPLVFP